MTEQFLRIEGATEIYDVVREGRVVGMVWRGGDVWHASATSMNAPDICEPTRELAAARL